MIKFVKSEFHELEQNHAIENVADIKMPSFIEVPQNGQNFEFECEFEEVKPEKILDACFAEVLIDAGTNIVCHLKKKKFFIESKMHEIRW